MDQGNGTVERQESKKVYVVIEKEDLMQICDRASKVAAEYSLESYKKERTKERARIREQRFNTAERLLKNYRLFQSNLANSVYDTRQLREEHDVSVTMILDMLEDENADLTVESIKASSAKTEAILKHINKVLDIYKAYCEQGLSESENRRYHELMDRYITSNLSISQIAEKYCITNASVYADLKAAKAEFAALIFGIDGMN